MRELMIWNCIEHKDSIADEKNKQRSQIVGGGRKHF